jgi:hypothetical protein
LATAVPVALLIPVSIEINNTPALDFARMRIDLAQRAARNLLAVLALALGLLLAVLGLGADSFGLSRRTDW